MSLCYLEEEKLEKIEDLVLIWMDLDYLGDAANKHHQASRQLQPKVLGLST